jgi:hypothetical protein
MKSARFANGSPRLTTPKERNNLARKIISKTNNWKKRTLGGK